MLHSRIAALSLALLVSLRKEWSLHPPLAALPFLALLKGGELWGKLSKYFQVCKTASLANRSPCRLAVPEKIFALLACSIFSTATDAPPRCIRHWRRSAPHPAHRDPFPGPGLLGYPSYLLHRSVSSAVTSGRWAFRSHICKSGAICARQPAAARPGRLYISRSAGFASSSASVSSRAV